MVMILRQMLRTRRLIGRHQNNRRHRHRRRPQYRACITVHRTALRFGLFYHDGFNRVRNSDRRKGFFQVTLDLLAGCLHRQSRNWTRRRRLAANFGALELAANRTPTPERARLA